MTTVVMECADVRLLLGRTVPFAAADSSRPVLNGIKIETAPNRVIAAAADGFILGVQTAPATVQDPGDGVIVDLDDVKFLERLIPKFSQTQKVRMTWADAKAFRLEVFTPGMPARKAIKASTGRANTVRPRPAIPAAPATPDRVGAAYECWPVQGTYPSYAALIPEWDGRDSLGAVAVSAHLMARVLKAWKAGDTHNAGIMRWHIKNPASPAVLTEDSPLGKAFIAVVMPMWVDLGSPIGKSHQIAKDGDMSAAEIPEYDHEGAIAIHRAILAKVLPAVVAAKPAAKRVTGTRTAKATRR